MTRRPLPGPGRRDFLKLLTAGTGGLMVGLPVTGGCRQQPEPGDALFEAFRSPSAEARPFFRWWWNGNRVTREELLRELRVMHEVGAGGIEINPIGMHEAIENPGGREIEWLSDEWTALVADVAAAREICGSDTVIDRASLDDVMVFMTRGESHVDAG